MKALVFIEGTGETIKKGGLELLSFCKASGFETYALILGSKAAALAKEAGNYGVKQSLICAQSDLDKYNPESFTQLVSVAIKATGPQVLLASASMLAKDLFPRVGAHENTGVASDCTSLEVKGGELVVRKPLFSGKCTAKVDFNNSPVKIVLMRPNQLPIAAPASGTAEVKELPLPETNGKSKIKEVIKGASERPDLAEAAIIVSGGRGMKGPEHFQLLNDLADALGATVGASRAVADAGWVPHSMQVGQTGKTVAPNLYIACGISGAIQHLAGMSGSKVIVAINKDPEAPIFQKATYGLVGDLFEIVPRLTEEFKKALH
jgi:electron transfer flavoprotein alpha subunit